MSDRTRHASSRPCRARPIVLALAAATAVVLVAVGTPVAVAGSQDFTTPTGRAENVRVERSPGEVITLSYDLASDDPQAVFRVALLVSRDGGKTFDLEPRSVTGDVGSGIRAGTGKKIVWQAGRDVESIEMEMFRFSIRMEAANARPVAAGPPQKAAGVKPAAAAPDPTAPARPLAPKPGRLEVRSTPPGATVNVDGQARGVTPITISDLPPGEHKVTFVRDGFLENARTVVVEAGKTARVSATLTPVPKPAAPEAGAEAEKKGSRMKWVLPLAGGAAAAGVLAAAKGGGGGTTPPSGGTTPTYTDSLTFTAVSPAPGSIIATGSSTILPGSGLISIGMSLSNSTMRPHARLEVYLLSNNEARTRCGSNAPDGRTWQNLAAGQMSVTVTGFQMGPFPCDVTGILAVFTTYSSYIRFDPPPPNDPDTIVEAIHPVSYLIR